MILLTLWVLCARVAARVHGPVRGQACDAPDDAATRLVRGDCDVEQPSRLGAECWDVADLDIDALSHADTIAPAPATNEVMP